jgi:predicted dehydrogenase
VPEQVRAGLVGYGSAGRGLHAPLLAAAGIHVAVVATGDPIRRSQVVAELDAEVVDDLAAVLSRTDLDLVVLASPSGVHAAQVRSCIAAGRPVVVDKPLACDADTAYRLVAEAAAAKVPLTVFQNRRYDPEFATLRDLVAEGALGELIRLELRWERWRPEPQVRWRERASWTDGGGLLLDLFTHLLDQAVLLFGPVHRVYADLAAHTTTAEDDAFVVLHHVNGRRSQVGAASVCAAPGPRVRLLGRAGAYLLASAGAEESALAGLESLPGHHGWLLRGPTSCEPVPARAADPADLYRQVAWALATADPQSAMPVDPMDAVHVLAIIDAARSSAHQGAAVEVLTPGR